MDRLERGTYVRRERGTKDRRKILVVPEEEGQQRLAQHYAGYGEHMQRVLARLTPRQLQTIAEFLDAMTDVDGGYIAQPPPIRHTQDQSSGSVRNFVCGSRRDLHGFGSWAGEDHA